MQTTLGLIVNNAVNTIIIQSSNINDELNIKKTIQNKKHSNYNL